MLASVTGVNIGRDLMDSKIVSALKCLLHNSEKLMIHYAQVNYNL